MISKELELDLPRELSLSFCILHDLYAECWACVQRAWKTARPVEVLRMFRHKFQLSVTTNQFFRHSLICILLCFYCFIASQFCIVICDLSLSEKLLRTPDTCVGAREMRGRLQHLFRVTTRLAQWYENVLSRKNVLTIVRYWNWMTFWFSSFWLKSFVLFVYKTANMPAREK